MIAINIPMPENCKQCEFFCRTPSPNNIPWCNLLACAIEEKDKRYSCCPLKKIELVRVKKIMDARDQELFFNNNAGHMDRYVRCEIERDALRDVHDEGLIRITKQRADQDVYFPGAIEYRGEMLIVKPDPVLRDGLMPE